MKKRDETREKARNEKNQNAWNEYKAQRNECTRLLKDDRTNFLKSKYENFEKSNDSKSTYRLLKQQAGWKSTGQPTSFLEDGKVIKSPLSMANLIMTYFHDKVVKLQEAIPPNQDDPLKYLKVCINRWKHRDSRNQFQINEVTEIEVLKAINDIGSSSSFGLEGLDATSLKAVISHVTKPITFIMNMSIKQNKYASKWKLAKTIPIYKGKSLPKNKTSSYRPISILPVMSKILEKLVQSQLMKFMIESKQISTNQHSYRTGHSTTSALNQIYDTLLEATDRNYISVLLSVDQSAAFDNVNHEILLEKLKLYNCGENSLKWFCSYLKNRSHCVSIGNKLSNFKSTVNGVPQGSILGPLLYIIYTNEMTSVMKINNKCQHETLDSKYLFDDNCPTCGTVINYADDATLIIASNSRIFNQDKLVEGLNIIDRFLTSNRLSINRSKTQIQEVMIGQKRAKTDGSPPSLLEPDENGEMIVIESLPVIKLLGANLQDNMGWSAHIETGPDALLPSLRKKTWDNETSQQVSKSEH